MDIRNPDTLQGMDAESRISSPGGANASLGYLFRVAHQAFRRSLETALAPHGLSVAQYSALSLFRVRPELTSADLARLADVTPQSMNLVVQQLVEHGLLERHPHPDHGRMLMLRPTARGRRLLDEATAPVREVERATLTGLSADEAAVVRRWLSGIIGTRA